MKVVLSQLELSRLHGDRAPLIVIDLDGVTTVDHINQMFVADDPKGGGLIVYPHRVQIGRLGIGQIDG